MLNARLIAISVITGAIILVAVIFVFRDQANRDVATAPRASTTTTASDRSAQAENPLMPPAASAPRPAPAEENVADNWAESSLNILGKLLLAVILSGILAFRPRKDVPLFKRSLFVSQTQILLSVVAAALMMIVGDNAARAFAIFAAVSLVRFRTNIRDPKEVTVLLISLALGLSAGVGRWDLGIALCLFSLALLWLLEFNESAQVYRSMELTVKTLNTDRAQAILQKMFGKYKLEAEMRQLDPPTEKDPVGCVVYYVNLRINLTTDQLSERILRADPENIDAIQWSQKKSATDIYQ